MRKVRIFVLSSIIVVLAGIGLWTIGQKVTQTVSDLVFLHDFRVTLQEQARQRQQAKPPAPPPAPPAAAEK